MQAFCLIFFQIFLEQKKMFKTGLNIARFREHVKIIEAETIEYFKRWGDSGERSEGPDCSLRVCSVRQNFWRELCACFQTCSRLFLSWSSSQPAAAFMGRRSAACWTSEWPSCTPTWMEDSVTLPGFCPAGCPCPASGRTARGDQDTHTKKNIRQKDVY